MIKCDDAIRLLDSDVKAELYCIKPYLWQASRRLCTIFLRPQVLLRKRVGLKKDDDAGVHRNKKPPPT